MTNNKKGAITRAVEALKSIEHFSGDLWPQNETTEAMSIEAAIAHFALQKFIEEINKYPNNMHKQALLLQEAMEDGE